MVGTVLAALAPTAWASASKPHEHPFAISSTWHRGVRNYIGDEESKTVFNLVYGRSNIIPAPNGGYLRNVHATFKNWYLEDQRYGAVDVVAGVLERDTMMVQHGMNMFGFALHAMKRNGSFPGSHSPFKGTSAFLAEAGPALLFLTHSPMKGQFGTEAFWQSQSVCVAARYLYHHARFGRDRINTADSYQYAEAALAFEAAGTLCKRKPITMWSLPFAKKWADSEQSDGVFPVHGGHDASYQARGMVDAVRWMELEAKGPAFRTVRSALGGGENWESSRVDGQGNLNTSGDTLTVPTCSQQNQPLCEQASPSAVWSAFARWSVVSNRASFAKLAMKLRGRYAHS